MRVYDYGIEGLVLVGFEVEILKTPGGMMLGENGRN
jgi:hypothetical protein